MRILVCGGRDFDNWYLLDECLTQLYQTTENYLSILEDAPPMVIIEGGAIGADFLSRVWAQTWPNNQVIYEEYPANWKLHGKAAGPIRNQQMLDEGKPDIVVAFPGGNGTADMVRRAKKAGIGVLEVKQ